MATEEPTSVDDDVGAATSNSPVEIPVGNSSPPIGSTGGGAGSSQPSALQQNTGGMEETTAPVSEFQRALNRYALAPDFKSAVYMYMQENDTPPQWNEWQKMVYAIATFYSEYMDTIPRKDWTSFFSNLYRNSQEDIFGIEWRLRRKRPDGFGAFAIPEPATTADVGAGLGPFMLQPASRNVSGTSGLRPEDDRAMPSATSGPLTFGPGGASAIPD